MESVCVCVFALLISHHTQEVSVSESCLQQKHEKEPLMCNVEVAKTFSSPANSSGRDFSCAPKGLKPFVFCDQASPAGKTLR